jgi:GntR family transcriptional regulator, histidine utilization repressor
MTALHERIRTDIEKKILGGELKPGDRLPIEHDLMAEYGCSRMTVNKAISALAAAGLVLRKRKAGTIVATPQAHAMVLDIPDLANEVRGRGQAYRYRLLHREVCNAAKVDASLEIEGDVLWTVGVHMADGKPFAHESRAVSLSAVPDIDEAVFDPEGPGTWLLRHVPWTEAETRISATGAIDGEAHALRVAEQTPCLTVTRRTWRAGEHITAVRQLFLGDSYSLVAHFGAGQQ